jgi:hypothetical protein
MTKAEDLKYREAIGAAEAQVVDARARKDRKLLARVLETRERLARAAGVEFLKCRRSPEERLTLNGAQTARMVRFCALDDEEFEKALAGTIRRAVSVLNYHLAPDAASSFNMRSFVSDWHTDESTGIKSRIIGTVSKDEPVPIFSEAAE